VSVGALPAIVPVHYELHGDEAWCSPVESAVVPLPHDGVVAFEADDSTGIDACTWSVLLVGRAQMGPAGSIRIDTGLASGRECQPGC
jgi:hypothetical protein